jgi:hypothetical protein
VFCNRRRYRRDGLESLRDNSTYEPSPEEPALSLSKGTAENGPARSPGFRCGSATGEFSRTLFKPLHDRQNLGQALLSAVLEDLFRQVVLYVSLIPHHFVVGGSQQLGAAIAQLLANLLLHPRVV